MKAATGQAYKMLRKVLKEQCKDEFLEYCTLKRAKVRTRDRARRLSVRSLC